jgi:hypothetical protein
VHADVENGLLSRKKWLIKVNLSSYMPWRRMGGEEVSLLLILNLGH